jgi:hypothetical protein
MLYYKGNTNPLTPCESAQNILIDRIIPFRGDAAKRQRDVHIPKQNYFSRCHEAKKKGAE